MRPCRCPRDRRGCSRAARAASSSSDLAPLRRAGRAGRSISTTHSPCSSRQVVKPAPNEPVPSIAQTRRSGAWSFAKARIRLAPSASDGTVRCAITPPVGSTTAAVWLSLWVSTPMTASTWSASMFMVALRTRVGDRCRRRAGQQPPGWQDCDGSRPISGGQASDQANASATQAGADSDRADISTPRLPGDAPETNDSFGSCPPSASDGQWEVGSCASAVGASLTAPQRTRPSLTVGSSPPLSRRGWAPLGRAAVSYERTSRARRASRPTRGQSWSTTQERDI